MPKRQEPQTPYDTIFDFIFSQPKPSKRRGKPGPMVQMPPLDSMGEVIGQVATAPYMYPTNQFMKDLDTEIGNIGKFRLPLAEGLNVDVKANEIGKFIADPRSIIDKAFKEYEESRKMGRWGARARQFDSALFALALYKSGMKAQEALGVGAGIIDIEAAKGAGTPLGGGNLGMDPSHMAVQRAQRNAATNLARYGASRYSGKVSTYTGQPITDTDLAKAIDRSSQVRTGAQLTVADKDARIAALENDLVNNHGFSPTEAHNYAQEVWGKQGAGNEKDYGIWLQQGNKDYDPTNIDPRKKGRVENLNNEEEIYKKSYESSLKLVQQRAEEAHAAAMDADRRGDHAEADRLEKEAQRLGALHSKMTKYEGKGNFFMSWGRGVGTAMHLNAWRKEYISNGAFINFMFTGNTFMLRRVLTFHGLKEGAYLGKTSSSHGLLSEDYLEGTSGTFGKAFEAIHYYHPVNIVKGLVWDGRLYAKWAANAQKRMLLSTDLAMKLKFEKRMKMFESLASKMPKQQAMRMWKNMLGKMGNLGFVNGIKAKVRDVVVNWGVKFLGKAAGDLAALPLKEILKQILTKIITQLITKILGQVIANAVLPGIGIIVGIVMDVVVSLAIKMLKPLVELVVLLLFGAVALMLIVCGGATGMVNKTFRHINNPTTATGGPTGEEIGQDQWASDSTPPAGMVSSCVVPTSNIICTQGPCGDTSHARRGSRAVDVAWGGMAGSPYLVAPTDGTVTVINANATCDDGTRQGGIIEFTDSEGYTWRIAHVRVVSSGAVTAGQQIAAVQYEPEVQVGNCWTGPHAHIEIRNENDLYVDAQEYLGGTGCSIACPAADGC